MDKMLLFQLRVLLFYYFEKIDINFSLSKRSHKYHDSELFIKMSYEEYSPSYLFKVNISLSARGNSHLEGEITCKILTLFLSEPLSPLL